MNGQRIYQGSPQGDVTGVTVGTGITGGGTSGTVTVSLDQAVVPTWTGTHTWARTAVTTGSPNLLVVTGPADTTLTASVEAIDIKLNLARTVQFATGALTTQRAMYLAGPTYAFVGASTITTAVTLDVDPPVAGTNATITTNLAIRATGIIQGASTSGPAFFSVTGASSANGGIHFYNAGSLVGKLHHSSSGDMTLVGLSGTALFLQGNKNASSTVANCIVYVATAAGAALASGICFDVQNAGTSALRVKWDGQTIITQAVNTSGSPTLVTVTGAAHTTLTASVEATDVSFNLARTVQFATGALTTQRAVQVLAPTYGFVGASTITNAATLYIDAAPTAGTNATITNKYSLWIDAGLPRIDSVTANGTTACVLTATSGPAAANTAVQEWLTIDINGVQRFIPVW